MSDIKRAAQFLLMARKDAEAVSKMAQTGGFPSEVFGLHAQQATEKALKAWLCLLGVRPPMVHDLDMLAGMLGDVGASLPVDCVSLLDLTDFAVQFRYEPYADFDEPFDEGRLAEQISLFIGHVERLLEEGTIQS